MPKFRKKPAVIEAVQWTGKNSKEIFILTDSPEIQEDFLSGDLTVLTLQGEITAKKGDYIVKDPKGSIGKCKPDIFEATYEPVE